MAIVLEANYAKKLGLPGYSSHTYSVTIRTELTDLSQIEAESARLYRVLQDAVDREIQEVGFMPDATTYGMNPPASNGGGEHRSNGGNGNGNGHSPRRYDRPNCDGNGQANGNGAWRCSDKQRDLIEKIVRENHLDKRDIEALAVEMFGAGVKQLDRLQASGLIDELLERHGNKPRGQKRPYRREPAHAHTQGGGGE
jgi:hypothetical protein